MTNLEGEGQSKVSLPTCRVGGADCRRPEVMDKSPSPLHGRQDSRAQTEDSPSVVQESLLGSTLGLLGLLLLLDLDNPPATSNPSPNMTANPTHQQVQPNTKAHRSIKATQSVSWYLRGSRMRG